MACRAVALQAAPGKACRCPLPGKCLPVQARQSLTGRIAQKRGRPLQGILHESHNEILSFLLSSRLYCRYRNLTGSAVKYGSRTVTAGRESHPAPKNFFLFCSILYAFICPISRDFSYKSQIQLFTNFIPEGYYNVYKVFPSQGVSHESLFSFCKHAPPLRL